MTNVVKEWEKYLNRDSAAGVGRLALPYHYLYMNKNYSSVKIFVEFLKIKMQDTFSFVHKMFHANETI